MAKAVTETVAETVADVIGDPILSLIDLSAHSALHINLSPPACSDPRTGPRTGSPPTGTASKQATATILVNPIGNKKTDHDVDVDVLPVSITMSRPVSETMSTFTKRLQKSIVQKSIWTLKTTKLAAAFGSIEPRPLLTLVGFSKLRGAAQFPMELAMELGMVRYGIVPRFFLF